MAGLGGMPGPVFFPGVGDCSA